VSLTIIGISGKAGTGKDYIAKTYFYPLGFRQISLADHFKLTVAGRGVASYDEVFHTKPDHVRKLLQEEGTERGRNVYGENVWCQTLLDTLRLRVERHPEDRLWIVPDVRFKNEVDFIQQHGGAVFRIYAPDRAEASTLTPAQRKHPSETELDAYDPVVLGPKMLWPLQVQKLRNGAVVEEPLFDAVFDNRYDYARSLDAQVTQVFRVHDLITPTQRVVAGRVEETGATWTTIATPTYPNTDEGPEAL
jgi:hypothetical protein